MNPRQPNRSSSEWIELITQHRQSKLSDSMWCEQQGIQLVPLQGYGRWHARFPRFQKKTKLSMVFTAKQEVVKIDIVPDHENNPEMLTPVPVLQALSEYLDNSHKIEIILGTASIRVSDGADPVLLEAAIRILMTGSC